MRTNIKSRYETIRVMFFNDREALGIDVFSNYLRDNPDIDWKIATEYWFSYLEKNCIRGEEDWYFLPGLRFDPFEDDFMAESYTQNGWKGIQNIELSLGHCKLWPILIEKPLPNIECAIEEIVEHYDNPNKNIQYEVRNVHKRHKEILLNTVWSKDGKMMAWEDTLHIFSF